MNHSPSQIAFLFPGQGSQKIGMGQDLAQVYPAVKVLFEQADDLLNFSLSKLTWEGPESDLNDTINTQAALLVHSAAALNVLQQCLPVQPAFVAGHSMGEISAFMAAGALAFPEALILARRRGELMKTAGEGSPGGMAAILGMDIPAVEQVCQLVSTKQAAVQIANDNCPGQVVISGSSDALDRAIEKAQQSGARKVTRLPISIAAHSPLMASAQADFNRLVDATPFFPPRIPIVGNVGARPLTTIHAIQQDLESQLLSRVRWTESILWMISQGVTLFIEIGSGSVLTSLLKRINRDVQGISLSSPADFDKLMSGEV